MKKVVEQEPISETPPAPVNQKSFVKLPQCDASKTNGDKRKNEPNGLQFKNVQGRGKKQKPSSNTYVFDENNLNPEVRKYMNYSDCETNMTPGTPC